MKLIAAALLCASPSLAQIAFLGAQSTVPATGLGHPFGTAVDSAGNLYIADTNHNQVIEITPSGTQSVVSVSPLTLGSPKGLAVDASRNLYIGDTGNSRIVKVPAGGGSATALASVNTPGGLAVDASGNVFVADTSDKKIAKITSAGTVSNFETGLGNPVAVAVDSSGNVYLADSSLTHVVKYPAAGGAGTNVGSSLPDLNGIAVDHAGNVYVAESGEGVALVEVTTGGPQLTLATSDLGAADFLVIDSNYNLFIPDDVNGDVVEFATQSVNMGFANVCRGGSPAPCSTTATLNFEGLDDSITQVSIVTLGTGKGEFSSSGGTCAGGEVSPCTVQVVFTAEAPGMQMGAVLLRDTNLDQLTSFPVYGVGMGAEAAFNPAETSPPFGTDGFQDPVAVALGGGGVFEGPILVADDVSCRIFELSFEEEDFISIAGTGTCGFSGDGGASDVAELNSPEDLVVDGAGNIYVADTTNNVIRKIDVNGNISTVAGNHAAGAGFSGDGGLATSAKINDPYGVAVDSAGNLYIADSENNRIRKVDLAGIITTVAGNGTGGYSGDGGPATSAELKFPEGVRVDASGNLYIADSNNNVVRKVDTTGKITTVAGNGTAGYTGDGNAATSAELNFPILVSVDAAGELFIADDNNSVIRVVNTSGKISTYAAPTGFPEDLVVDLDGNLAMVDPDAEAVVLVARIESSGLSFANQTVNTSSAAQDATVLNIGNQTLNLTAITPPTGFNTSGTDTTCTSSTSLNLGLSCILGIKFAPTTIGDFETSLTITDNSLGPAGSSTQGVPLLGTSVGITTTTTLTASPSPAFFGQSVTLTATVSPVPTGESLGTVTFCLGTGPDIVTGVRPSLNQSLEQWKSHTAVIPDVSACGSGTVLGTSNVNSSGQATLALTTLPVGTDDITAVYSGNPALAPSTSSAVSETINAPVTTTTTIAASPNPSPDGQTVTLTATVSPTPTVSPLGTVTFCDAGAERTVRLGGRIPRASPQRATGSAPEGELGNPCGSNATVGSASLSSSGTASITTTTLTVGDHNIYAVYSGSVSAAASASDPVDETISTAYTVTAPPEPVDVSEGGSVQVTVTVPPLGGAYNNLVTLSATGLPPGATATFTPPTVTPGAEGEQTQMTLQLAPIVAYRIAARGAPLLASFGLLLALPRFRKRSWPRLVAMLIIVAAISAGALGLTSCNAGFAGLSTPKGQYIVTVTGTSGSLHPSTTVTVVVQ